MSTGDPTSIVLEEEKARGSTSLFPIGPRGLWAPKEGELCLRTCLSMLAGYELLPHPPTELTPAVVGVLGFFRELIVGGAGLTCMGGVEGLMSG